MLVNYAVQLHICIDYFVHNVKVQTAAQGYAKICMPFRKQWNNKKIFGETAAGYYCMKRRLTSRHFPFVVEDNHWAPVSRMHSLFCFLFLFIPLWSLFIIIIIIIIARFHYSCIVLYICQLSSCDIAVLCWYIVRWTGFVLPESAALRLGYLWKVYSTNMRC